MKKLLQNENEFATVILWDRGLPFSNPFMVEVATAAPYSKNFTYFEEFEQAKEYFAWEMNEMELY